MARGGVFGLGILFRVREFILGIPISPWTDLLRCGRAEHSWLVDDLQIFVLGGGRRRVPVVRTVLRTQVGLAMAAAAAVAQRLRPCGPPGGHDFAVASGVVCEWSAYFDKPQVWLFPIFPWAAFAFVGLAVGFWLFTDFAQLPGVGVLALALAGWRRLAWPWRWTAGGWRVCGLRLLAYESEFFSGALRVIVLICAWFMLGAGGDGESGDFSRWSSWGGLRYWCGCILNLCMEVSILPKEGAGLRRLRRGCA